MLNVQVYRYAFGEYLYYNYMIVAIGRNGERGTGAVGDAPRDGDGDGLLPCRLVAMLHGRAKISHRVDVEGRVARITPSHESDLDRTLLVSDLGSAPLRCVFGGWR